jgi:hypothetical protein
MLKRLFVHARSHPAFAKAGNPRSLERYSFRSINTPDNEAANP